MKISEFRKLIREEIQKILENAVPIEAQDFAAAAKKKYKDALLGVEYFNKSGLTVVKAYVDVEKWNLVDKYWANKYTKTLGNNAFRFLTVPEPVKTYRKNNMRGTEVKIV
jgi:hypothetical protein